MTLGYTFYLCIYYFIVSKVQLHDKSVIKVDCANINRSDVAAQKFRNQFIRCCSLKAGYKNTKNVHKNDFKSVCSFVAATLLRKTRVDLKDCEKFIQQKPSMLALFSITSWDKIKATKPCMHSLVSCEDDHSTLSSYASIVCFWSAFVTIKHIAT